MTTILRFAALTALTGLLAACGLEPTAPAPAAPTSDIDGPSQAALALTDNTIIPIEVLQNVPCANGGAGEDVLLTGTLHILTHITFSNAGNLSITTHFQPQGLTGLGMATGDKYQGTGVTRDHLHLSFGENYTAINNFRMIGQGPGNNFLVHETLHYTVDANGSLKVFHDKISVECK